jgi:solute carrier family 25 carnitine/acylcarnitine transporter 20/29
VSFWGYDIGQQIVNTFRSGTGPMNLSQIAMAGGISALPTTAIMAPTGTYDHCRYYHSGTFLIRLLTIFSLLNNNHNHNTERIKCLLQVQSHASGKPQYSGMTDCAKQVYRSGGIRSLYKGTLLTLSRDIPGSIAWFGTYEIIKRKLVQLQGIEDPSKLSPLAVMVAGGFAGMACWGVSIPPDVLKSRYQTAPEGKYSSVLQVYHTLVKEEGYGALLTGFRPAMIRAFPANAACFLAMEVAKNALSFLD